MLGMTHTLPRWLIDDTAGIADGRVFAMHTWEPRCIGELLPLDELSGEASPTFVDLPDGQALCRVNWLDSPDGLLPEQMVDLCNDLALAMTHHQGVRDVQG